jgi:hypothetical protein
MADIAILPTWAMNYLSENLGDRTHIVNVLPLSEGRSRRFLINTSQGAVLLQRGFGKEPSHWFLPLPARHFSFICHECMERIEFVDPEVPRIVHCTHCGVRYRLDLTEGSMVLARDQTFSMPKVTPPEQRASAKVSPKPAPKASQSASTTALGSASKKTAPKLARPAPERKQQCGAFTEDGKQCRLTAASRRNYCHIHKNYKPITRDEAFARLDTSPRAKAAIDTLPATGNRGDHANQCAAITGAGGQCSNRSGEGSKYCEIHKSYRPTKGLKSTDTKPVGKSVKDTKPTVASESRRRK